MTVENEDHASVPQDAVRDEAIRSGDDTRSSRLDEEGDVAADYLEELLDIADIDGDIDIEVREGRSYISIVSEDPADDALSSLVGPDGEVLEALQELTRLSVLTAADARSRLVLDIDGYRDRREGELTKIAQDAAQKARDSGDVIALAPMTAYERKIVHDAIAELGLSSESEGEGHARHIVISVSDD